MLSPEQILTKTSEAVEMGATEICLQAGLAPISNPHFYRNLLEGIKYRLTSDPTVTHFNSIDSDDWDDWLWEEF
jgi:2-iminoacetate synthase ThiH